MNRRRLGVALILVGVLFGAIGTYSAISVDAGNEVPIRLECNPEFNETADARHEVTVSTVVEGEDSGAEMSLDRTVTANVECN